MWTLTIKIRSDSLLIIVCVNIDINATNMVFLSEILAVLKLNQMGKNDGLSSRETPSKLKA